MAFFNLSRGNQLAAVFLFILCVLTLQVRVSAVLEAEPYLRHVDEQVITESSTRMLKEGTLKPLQYYYPAFPIYLTAAAQWLGYAASDLTSRKDIKNFLFPYVENPEVIRPARMILCILSVLVIALGSLAFWQFFGRHPLLLILPGLWIASSEIYFYYSWNYINNNIIVTFFIFLAYFHLAFFWKRPELLHKIYIPGAIAGLTMASKYPFALIIIPYLLVLKWEMPDQFKVYRKKLFTTLFAFFILAAPYSLLNFPKFASQINKQRRIYSNGWPGFNSDPGLPHFFNQIGYLIKDFGQIPLLLAVFGIIGSIRRYGKIGWLLFSFPLVFMLYFSMQKVSVERNWLHMYPMLALYAALGTLFAFDELKKLHSFLIALHYKFLSPIKKIQAKTFAASLLSVFLLAYAPWKRILAIYTTSVESRNQATHWIQQNLPKGSTVFIASELQMKTDSLEKDYKIVPFKSLTERPNLEKKKVEILESSIFLSPIFGYDFRHPERLAGALEANSLFNPSKAEVVWGDQPVLIKAGHQERRSPSGNPMISLFRGLPKINSKFDLKRYPLAYGKIHD